MVCLGNRDHSVIFEFAPKYCILDSLSLFYFFFWLLVLESLVGLHRTVQLQLLQCYYLGQTWITVILNGLPWKRTDIILLFLRLYPNIAFGTLLLTTVATPFLLRDSCPQ